MLKIAFIINPISGKGKGNQIPDLIEKYLDKSKFNHTIVFTQYGGHGKELATKFVHENYNIVVAVGGDGTMSEVASGIANTNTALAIIPLGSGNGLARFHGYSLNPKIAIKQLNRGKFYTSDYGIIDDTQTFFCTCGIGYDAYISQCFAQQSNRGLKTYLKIIFKTFFSYKPLTYKLLGDKFKYEGEAFLITFANANQWGNNAYVAPEAVIDDGLMDISILTEFPKWKIPVLAYQLFTKKVHKSRYVKTYRTKSVIVTREEAGPFHFDGESFPREKTIKIELINNKLKIFK